MLCPYQGRQGACKLSRLISPILWSTLSVWSFGSPVSDFFHGRADGVVHCRTGGPSTRPEAGLLSPKPGVGPLVDDNLLVRGQATHSEPFHAWRSGSSLGALSVEGDKCERVAQHSQPFGFFLNSLLSALDFANKR